MKQEKVQYNVFLLIKSIKRIMIEYSKKRNSITLSRDYWTTTTFKVVWIAK
jgi:hypothetical protein